MSIRQLVKRNAIEGHYAKAPGAVAQIHHTYEETIVKASRLYSSAAGEEKHE